MDGGILEVSPLVVQLAEPLQGVWQEEPVPVDADRLIAVDVPFIRHNRRVRLACAFVHAGQDHLPEGLIRLGNRRTRESDGLVEVALGLGQKPARKSEPYARPPQLGRIRLRFESLKGRRGFVGPVDPRLEP